MCKSKLEVNGEGQGLEFATTFEGTETGKPVAAVTITNPANLALATVAPGDNMVRDPRRELDFSVL